MGVIACVVALASALSGCAAGAGSSAGASSALSVASQTPLTELEVLEDPKSYVGESTATLVSESVTPVTDDPEQSLPVTVTSHDSDGDVEVTVSDTSRIIPMDLSGSIASTVFALGFGDSVVGRDISTTFPEAEDLPVVTGSSHSINAEAVLALEPTLVITDGSIGPRDVVAQLRDAGVTVVFVNNESSVAGAAQLALDVADVLGAPEAGELLSERISSEVAQVSAEIDEIVPADEDDRLRMVFLYLRGGAGVYYLFGEGSGADELIEALGGIDVASEIGWVGEKPMTAEALAEANPDLILVMTSGLESVGGVDGLLESKPEVAVTNAGVNRRFVDMADGDILSFGPRSADILDALARAIYAPDAS